ncbi:MAG: HAD-IIB family hydrolase [Myxococcota bacterium]|nr:HAD-IIB family hydrolase [Myxococcota bacterium]
MPSRVIDALRRARMSGLRLIMVTGRELPDLRRAFAEVDLFDEVVAENGGVLHSRATRATRILGPRPAETFVQALRDRGVEFSAGSVVVATRESDLPAVREAISVCGGRDLSVILNKGSVMILPAGIDKGSGLVIAAADIAIEPSRIVGMGDGENDESLLHACGLGFAVSDAVPALKVVADGVTRGARGDGVMELIEKLLCDGLSGYSPRARRGWTSDSQ